jgi:hypothetical protein
MLFQLFLGNINQLKLLTRNFAYEELLVISRTIHPLMADASRNLEKVVSHFQTQYNIINKAIKIWKNALEITYNLDDTHSKQRSKAYPNLYCFKIL